MPIPSRRPKAAPMTRGRASYPVAGAGEPGHDEEEGDRRHGQHRRGLSPGERLAGVEARLPSFDLSATLGTVESSMPTAV